MPTKFIDNCYLIPILIRKGSHGLFKIKDKETYKKMNAEREVKGNTVAIVSSILVINAQMSFSSKNYKML